MRETSNVEQSEDEEENENEDEWSCLKSKWLCPKGA